MGNNTTISAGIGIAETSAIFPRALEQALQHSQPKVAIPANVADVTRIPTPHQSKYLSAGVGDDGTSHVTSSIATAVNTISDYIAAPSLLNTFEANEALQEVFGVTGPGGGLEDKDIQSAEQIRLRRVFQNSAHGGLEEEMNPGHAGYANNKEHLTLHKVRPDSELEDAVFKFRKDMSRCKKLKEVAFRGVSLHEVMETLGDQLAEELLSNLTDELETIFSDYADTFVGEI